MSNELKLCPFCGSNNVYPITINDDWGVRCSDCDATGPIGRKLTAIDAWNIRPIDNLDTNLEQSSDCLAPDINPDRCQWEYLKHNKHFLYPGCNETVAFGLRMVRQWEYCPYCGRKILK